MEALINPVGANFPERICSVKDFHGKNCAIPVKKNIDSILTICIMTKRWRRH
jgi:hypothetical protein